MITDHGISVRAIIIKHGCLLVEWWEPDKCCFPPGGRIIPPEKLEEALQRELREELATDEIVLTKYLGKILSRWQRNGQDNQNLNHYYSCAWDKVDISAPLVSGEPGREFRWITIEDLKKYNLVPPMLCELIPLLQQGSQKQWEVTVE